MKVNVLVPTTLSEITLEQFVRIINSEEKNAGTTFQMQKTVEIVCGIDLQSVATIKYSDVKSIYDHIQKLFQGKPGFIPKFKMDGQEYGFIPELDEMSFGEYIDIDENMSSWDTMHNAMAVLFRPITHSKEERYDIEKYQGLSKAEKYKDMPVDVALGANFFLFSLGIELLETTLNFSKEDRKQMTLEQKHSLARNGAGFQASLDSLKEMLQKSNISLN